MNFSVLFSQILLALSVIALVVGERVGVITTGGLEELPIDVQRFVDADYFQGIMYETEGSKTQATLTIYEGDEEIESIDMSKMNKRDLFSLMADKRFDQKSPEDLRRQAERRRAMRSEL